MKTWWPWRRKRTFTLFEERIPWLGEAPDAKLIRLARQGPSYLQRHPLNTVGPFYVGHGECMTCGYPHVLAPDLMAWEMNSEGRVTHCYFRKQPETSQEIEQAVNAVNGSCCGALRYTGSDAEIINRIS